MAIDTDNNKGTGLSDTHGIFIAADQLFCVYFTAELLIRYMAFKRKLNCFRVAWFVFDAILVVFIIADTWILQLVLELVQSSSTSSGSEISLGSSPMLRSVRLLRLSRLFRMAHVVRKVPELLIMVKALGAAARSVGIAIMMLAMVLYVFAIAFTSVLEDTSVGQESFRTVSLSMHSLLMHGAFLDDISGVMHRLLEESYMGFAMMYVVIMLAAVSVMNMLIGILCEVISAVSDVEHEAIQMRYVTQTLRKCLTQTADTDCDGTVSPDEFLAMLSNREAVRALKEIDIDVLCLVDYVNIIFGDGHDNIPFPDLIQVLLQLRGGNTCTVKDLIDLRKWLSGRLGAIELLTQQRDLQKEVTSQEEFSDPAELGLPSQVMPFPPEVVSESNIPLYQPSLLEEMLQLPHQMN